MLASCGQQKIPVTVTSQESKEAKALMQGIWMDAETGNAVMRIVGDSVYYPDTITQPAYFKIVDDSLVIGLSSYAIVKQTPHVFWFQNQSSDVVKLDKSVDKGDTIFFTHRRPKPLSVISEVVKSDSVVYFQGERYHWYITVNPTKFLVSKASYSHDGVKTETDYYDNIINLNIYQGDQRLFFSDFKKQMFTAHIPETYLLKAILSKMEYDHVNADGFHFRTTICEPDGGSCYIVSCLIGFDGALKMELLEY